MLLSHQRLEPAFEELLGRAIDGERLSRADGERLIRAQGSELPALMFAAALMRDQGHGRTVSYSRKVFIPLTNLCRQKCGYCTFARGPKDPVAHTMSPDEVMAVAEAGRRQGCKEALFSLGEKPEEIYDFVRDDLRRFGHDTMISYLREQCERVLSETGLLPHANPGIMSREEVASLRESNVSMGLMLETTSDRLHGKGEAHFNCPGKIPEERLETMRFAGEQGIAFTTGILIGIGETWEERIDSLFAIKEVHEEHGNIQEVIVQNFRVKDDIAMRHKDEPSVFEMLRTIATARLIMGPAMNIQAPPNLTPDAYGLYLMAGINDWGGVSPVTRDHINPEAPWPKLVELKEVTEEAGFQLRERLAIYPQFAAQDRFVRESCRAGIDRWTDESGLVRWEAHEW
ncbi:MAG: 7,8-didemethyl-8-hydroxy-5-deazariboflavin synthase CofG [Chloroflexi bacterium]|nr:7,8-didemethyl-8-hydroxy-5-deazariboflavin synthase CofG [Chloroflexota bacterium]